MAGWVLIALLAASPSIADAGDGSSSEAARRTKQILDQHQAQGDFPGAVLALDDPDGLSVVVSTGIGDPANESTAVDPDVPWMIGTATQPFVAVVVLQLAQAGELDLDQSIDAWFPGLAQADQITTRQLLQHTSGLAEYLDTDVLLGDAQRAWTPDELIAAAVASDSVAEPEKSKGSGLFDLFSGAAILRECQDHRVLTRREGFTTP
jgi:D-alanyl-D-alanine carboxypeptidase